MILYCERNEQNFFYILNQIFFFETKFYKFTVSCETKLKKSVLKTALK